MKKTNLTQYPSHWQSHIRAYQRLGLITILEGLGILIWQLAVSSEPDSRIFLNHSLEGWVLILASLVMIASISLILWTITNRPDQVQKRIGFLDRDGTHTPLAYTLMAVLGLTIAGNIWLLISEPLKPYYPKLLPVILLLTLTIFQVCGLAAFILRKTVREILGKHFPLPGEKSTAPEKIHKAIPFIMAGLFVLYLLVQGWTWFSVKEAAIYPDSNSYFYGAGLKLSNPEFWSERRPWGILMLYKILGNSRLAIDLAQTLVSTAAWSLLAWAFSRQVSNQWLKVASVFTILCFSLIPVVQLWNHAVLSESFSISMMILILALMLLLLQKWNWPVLLAVIFCFVVLMSVRESSAYIGLLVAILLILASFFWKQLRVLTFLSLAIIAIFVINFRLSSAYALPRWGYPMAEVITKRILPNSEYLEYFESHGMPVNEELLDLTGEWANRNNYAVVNSVGLKHFMNWLFKDGPNVYARFLLSHPVYAITEPVKDANALLANYARSSGLTEYPVVMPPFLAGLLYPHTWIQPYLWITLLFVAVFFFTSLRSKKSAFWISLLFFLLAIPHLYLVWHGDAHSVPRHAVVANIQFRIGAWLLFYIFIDNILAGKLRLRHTSSEKRS